MSTYNLRRFAHVDGLKSIAIEHLHSLLSKFSEYLERRGFTLTHPVDPVAFEYETLTEILMNPADDTPKDLIDALYLIHEMSDDDYMDLLLQEAESKGIELDLSDSPTVADVAVQLYLKDPNLLDRKHAEQYLSKPRSFEYFQSDKSPAPPFVHPSEDKLIELEAALDVWYEKKKRGRGTKVFIYPKVDSIWFLIRHGDPFKREGTIVGDQSSSVFYRPEKYDVLVYDPALGEIRMHTCNKGEKELFRKEIGLHIFGDAEFFPGDEKYTLEPLRELGSDSVICTDVEGMEYARLVELQLFWGGAEKEIEIRKAHDLFAALASRDKTVPERGHLLRASFQIKFKDSKTPRNVTIRPSNIALYSRDSDAHIVEEWLTKRGFIIAERDDEEEN